ncbi:hypothetical protein LTR10_002798 [Elasticomyces elasticus]|uniref:gamma-glutamylcyclotransferase n=1 Tax=Elasticomyces elasticus TaxID=574655 RepID=A0AAN7VR76_9PEZI|nr:hypothetical protein LTR10_002798 [Elasticomyces elasticus]KAK4967862.1 hypothetical protein LTR42_010190 [Elasticomyces elasticus]KAK5699565.1 hypothetical protein LTR97_005693 [Elasticomyces elasticus]KAK5721777.1 hypothetical protein LTR15_006369 [Elasticomyces elasticus]
MTDQKHTVFDDDLSQATLYLGYGSNLWMHQMKQRCPTSKYVGIARLDGFRWIINERGYANIVAIPREDRLPNHFPDKVWGLVYSLEQSDEDKLDVNEGVPSAYTKEYHKADLWHAKDGKASDRKEGSSVQVELLVYINRKLTTPHEPRKEYVRNVSRFCLQPPQIQGCSHYLKQNLYLSMLTSYVPQIYRMNMGIKDAIRERMPPRYVEAVIRPFIPEDEDAKVAELAKKQAQSFEDE